MKEQRFLIFENAEKQFHQQIALSSNKGFLTIGTSSGCDVSIPNGVSTRDFTLILREEAGVWIVDHRSVNVKVKQNNRMVAGIHKNTAFMVCDMESDKSLFWGRYIASFDYTQCQYNRKIKIGQMSRVMIGSEKDNHIILQAPFAEQIKYSINQEGTFVNLMCLSGMGNLYHNEKKVTVQQIPLYNFDFFRIENFSFYYCNKTLYVDNRDAIAINGLAFEDIKESTSSLHYPEFVRNSRLQYKINDEPFPLLAPKEKPTKPKSNLFLKLMPAVGMIALTILLRGVMQQNSNITFILFSVCSMVMGALVSVFTIINDKKEYKTSLIQRDRGYRDYIAKKDEEIGKIRQSELNLLNNMYYRYDQLLSFVNNFSGNMFDRIPEDADFLEVRIGTGTIEAVRKIDYKPQEKYEADDDPLVELPVQLSEKYRKIENAPIVLQLKEANVIGVVSQDPYLYEMMKIIYLDLCMRQHYDDVQTYLIIDHKSIEKFGWIKWFKHINNAKGRNIVCDSYSRGVIFEKLYNLFSERENKKGKENWQHIVVFVMSDCGIKQHPLSKYIEHASDYGATFIFFENTKEYIPLGCSQLVLIDSVNSGRVVKNESTDSIQFSYAQIPDNELYMISHKLAPIYCQEINLEQNLTSNITFFQMLGIKRTNEINLRQNWTTANILKTLKAPIGVKSENELIYLDIKDGDKSHGPHGLVAGTTGSGKSELLMTYILSMAIHYSPQEVAFLIIDFKGGGMADNFKDLPHTLGIITNIDGKEINRSLISISAEVKRRQELLKKASEKVGSVIKNIDEYTENYKAGKLATPLPHLIIVVDEFAELKAQFNDFMEELKSTARIGRTLGIHLILATQRPQGQVDPQIDSNSKFRLCLKVQSSEDSKEIIKSPLAAEIKETGRCYMMVGNNEIFELFQSAYSGVDEDNEIKTREKLFSIYNVDFSGKRSLAYRKKKQSKEDVGTDSQSAAVVKYINRFCEINKIKKLPTICQPALPYNINYNTLGTVHRKNMCAVIGTYDAPEYQLQDYLKLEFTNMNTLLIGSMQMGKTNFLELITRDVAEHYTPKDVEIYILDYSSMILSNLQELPHVGGVVCANENERLRNLLKLLSEQMKKRKRIFKEMGVGSYNSYKESGKNDLPFMLLLIDGLESLLESLKDSAVFADILTNGLSCGIGVVATDATMKGEKRRYLSLFPNKIALYNNNADEYAVMFGISKLRIDAKPGRGYTLLERKPVECQILHTFEGEHDVQKIASMKAFVERIQAKYPNQKATQIPQIPKLLREDIIAKNFAKYYTGYNIILGFDYDTMLPMTIDMSHQNLIISGMPKSGKTNFANYMISTLQRNAEQAPVKIAVFDSPITKSLENIAKSSSCVEHYEISGDKMSQICKEWKTELERRKKLVQDSNGDLTVLEELPLLMMICEDSSKEYMNGFDESLLNLLHYKFSIVVTNAPTETISTTNKLYKLKSGGANCLAFGSVVANKLFNSFTEISMQEKTTRLKVETTVGDAFYVEATNAAQVYRLKTIQH